MALLAAPLSAAPLQIVSPDNKVEIDFEIKEAPLWGVRYQNKEVIASSPLGLTLQNVPFGNFEVEKTQRDEKKSSWSPLYGERATIPENYRELTVHLREKEAPRRRLQIVLRAYNEGAALRYFVPEQEALKTFVVEKENTQFQFPKGSFGWEEHGTEGEYARVSG